MEKKKIGLYFGSFNPITNAHVMVALQALEYSNKFQLDEVWFVVSPQNPHKKANDLAPINHRVNMIEKAIEEAEGYRESNTGKLKCCTTELELPVPSYTHNTFEALEEENKDCEFTVVCGADTYDNIPNWKYGNEIWNKYNFLVVERGESGKEGYEMTEGDDLIPGHFSVSATLVRDRVTKGLSIASLVPSSVREYIHTQKLYKTLDYIVKVADEFDMDYVEEISKLIEESAKQRGVGIAKRSTAYLSEKIKKGQALIALNGDEFVGFCYIESWQGKKYVANSGLIVTPKYRGRGVSKAIKEKAFDRSRELFPDAKLFSITTNGAVMKMNNNLGYKPVPFNELTSDYEFWYGCSTCPHYKTLMDNNKTYCLCTGLLYEPN